MRPAAPSFFLDGNSGPNRIVGADVLYDGTGIDTLESDGVGSGLNLSAARRTAIAGIEKIDITGSGNNIPRFRLNDVLNFGDKNVWNAGNTDGVSGEVLGATEACRQLRVEGNGGDQVVVSDLANRTRAANSMVADGSTDGVWNHSTSLAQMRIDSRVVVA